MKPKVKKTGAKWLVYGYDLRFCALFDTWRDAIRFALLKAGVRA